MTPLTGGGQALTLPLLEEILGRAQTRGWIGPGPIEGHCRHSLGFAEAAELPHPPARALDLGAGGGVPGLPLAEQWPGTEFVLLESNGKRAGFLDSASVELGWSPRVRSVHARAEDAAHDKALRGSFEFVTARSFGPPAVTAECAAPLLVVGGTLVVSDPPGGAGDRWGEAISLLGLEFVAAREAAGAHFSVFRQASPCPEDYPRKAGLPARRPLF